MPGDTPESDSGGTTIDTRVAELSTRLEEQSKVLSAVLEKLEQLQMPPARAAGAGEGESSGAGNAAGRGAAALGTRLWVPPGGAGGTGPPGHPSAGPPLGSDAAGSHGQGEIDGAGGGGYDWGGWGEVEGSRTRLRITPPPQFKGNKSMYPGWRMDFLRHAGSADLTENFVGEGDFPDTQKSRSELRREGFTWEIIDSTHLAWRLLTSAIISESDKNLIRQCPSPRDALKTLDSVHKPETQGAVQDMFRKFNEYQTRVDQNPVEALNELEYLRGQIYQCGNAYLQDPIVFTRFIDSLPSEYEVSKETLASTTDLTRDTLIRVVITRFHTISKKAGREKTPKAGEQAFLARDGKGGQRGGHVNGRNKRGKGGSTGENSGKSNGGAPDHQRCFRCNHKGHYKRDCDTEESKFIPRCEKCSGFGHTKEKCPSVDEVATLAIQLPEGCNSLEEMLDVEHEAL